MDNSWDNNAGTWDTNRDVIYYSDKAYESLIEIINIENKRILDFGCGTGLLTERVSPLANGIVAIDTSQKMIQVLQAKDLANVTPLAAPLSKELIDQNSAFNQKFDLVIASSVLSFIPDYQSTLKLLKSLLVKDGLFVQWDWLQTNDDPDFGLSEITIKNSLNKTGFSDIILSKPFSITFEKGEMQVVMGAAKNCKSGGSIPIS